MNDKSNMEQRFCDKCRCIQWMFTWCEDTWRGRMKYLECPDCGRLIKERPHDKREHERERQR